MTSEWPVSALGQELTEEPNPDATKPTGMCGSSTVCERCPSTLMCWVKAGKELEMIRARSKGG